MNEVIEKSGGVAGGESVAAGKSFTRFVTPVARILMGLMFFVFGLNGFIHFMPTPPNLPEPVASFLGAMMKTGYMMPLISGTQVIVGALLLINRFVPLALALIAPEVVNIILFHIYLSPQGLGMAIFVVILELYLAWAYRKAFAPMLAAKVRPGVG